MRILYLAHQYDYGDPRRGESYEHANFYDALCRMGHDILYYDFVAIAQRDGRDAMNRCLLELVRAEKPTLMFTVAYKDYLDPQTVRSISHDTDTATVNWFCDDHWRFDSFSRHWAPCFNWVVTTAQSALPRYWQMGCENVIKSQWACNPAVYHKSNLPLIHDVSFVGLPYGRRRGSIQSLRRAGIAVKSWGGGWPAGRLSQEQMVQTFAQSRINLNFTEASTSAAADRVKRFWNSRVQPVLHAAPGGWRLDGPGRTAAITLTQRLQPPPRQIKGRVFEVPACGGFLMTGQAENLNDYLEIGREAAVFDHDDDLVAKVRHYLANEELRASIAEAGYQRVLREHTYAQRFDTIFKHMGLDPAAASPLAKAA